MKLIFVSGLSGAGKTVALKQYEDIGYYCIDNLPLQLIGPFIRRALRRSDGRYEKLAIGIDARETAPEIARRSEEHTSELQSLMRISYAVFCLQKKKKRNYTN